MKGDDVTQTTDILGCPDSVFIHCSYHLAPLLSAWEDQYFRDRIVFAGDPVRAQWGDPLP